MKKISIIIPTCNRRTHLSQCLDGISNQNNLLYLDKIIIVNDCDESIEEIINKSILKKKIIILKTNHKGPCKARNRALQFITSYYVAFLDDDATPVKGWLDSCMKLFQNKPNITAQLGKILWEKEKKKLPFYKKFIPTLRQKLYDSRHFEYISNKNKKISKLLDIEYDKDIFYALHISGGNFAIKYSFFKNNFFNDDFFTYHDKELAYRLISTKNIIAYNPNMIIYHDHDPSIIRALKRSFTIVPYQNKLKNIYPDLSIKLDNIYFQKLAYKLTFFENIFIFLQKILQKFSTIYYGRKAK